jgi:hypothetical protein
MQVNGMQVNGLLPVTYFSIVEYTRNGSVFPEIFLDFKAQRSDFPRVFMRFDLASHGGLQTNMLTGLKRAPKVLTQSEQSCGGFQG